MHLVQVGVGSGGIAVLDALLGDPRLTCLTLIDPDVYQAHNVARHRFGQDAVGQPKVTLARDHARRLRPELPVEALPVAVGEASCKGAVLARLRDADVAVCAVDSEVAKYHCDELFRHAKLPWTLGEVLSGGIAGWVHRFTPGGACYGCVASRLGREFPHGDPAHPPPDYAAPESHVAAATVPASKASVAAVAASHALLTLDLLDDLGAPAVSWLLPFQVVPELFAERFRGRRFDTARMPECLVCGTPIATGDLDASLAEALTRLG